MLCIPSSTNNPWTPWLRPFLVFIVRDFNFSLGPIIIDEFNAAGIFGTFQWSIFLVIFVMLYRDQPLWVSKDKTDEEDSFVEENKQNNQGQKYLLRQTGDPSLIQTPIMIALFACFCGFSVQAGLETFVTIFTFSITLHSDHHSTIS